MRREPWNRPLNRVLRASGVAACGLVATGVLVSYYPDAVEWAFAPLWLTMVLCACRYGLAGALASSFTGVLGYAWLLQRVRGGIPVELSLPDPTDGVLVLFAVGVLIVGVSSHRLKEKLAAAVGRIDQFVTERNGLQLQFHSLLSEQQILARQVISQDETIVAVSKLFDELDEAQVGGVPAALLRVARCLTRGGKAAIYFFNDKVKGGRLLADDGSGWPSELSETTPVVNLALAERRQATLAQVQLPRASDDARQIHIASPIEIPGRNSRLLLVMTELPLIAFVPTRLSALVAAANIAAQALARPSRRPPGPMPVLCRG